MTRHRSLRRRGHGLRNALIVVGLLTSAAASIGYLAWFGGPGRSAMVVEGQSAPLFQLPSVTNGTSFELGNYAGKSDVLLFFNEGLACSPCLQQMVDMDRRYSAFIGMGVVPVAITTDSPANLKTWARNNQISNMMVLADSSLTVDREYGTLGRDVGSMHAGMAPGHTFILVSQDGTVLWRKDYGTYTMYVQMEDLLSSVRSALG